MKRFALGILVALAIAFAGASAQTHAAPSQPPHQQPGAGVGGKVASVDGTTITVTNPQGTLKIAITSSTTFEVNKAKGSLSGITAGMFVHADGAKAADGTFTATRVFASSNPPSGGPGPQNPPKGAGVGGKVVSVDGTTITVTNPQGTLKIATTSDTTFEVNKAKSSLSGITAGMFVHADGTKAADGTFTARCVFASTNPPSGGPAPKGAPQRH